MWFWLSGGGDIARTLDNQVMDRAPVYTNTTNYVPSRKPNWKRYYKYNVIYDSLINKYANDFSIDKNIVKSIITWESNWTAGGTSPQNCKGLMQVMGGSHNPEKNIKQGCRIYYRYSQLMRAWFKTHFNIELDTYDLTLVTLTAYNRGCGGARKYYRKHVRHNEKIYIIKHSKYALSVMWIYRQIAK